MAPDYESLCLLQKIEVFEYALENTTGQDLYRVLWLKSLNSEHWLERRATYTRSLAVNSMVGHILGLGDRHPSNVLLERSTGKVVHIDFGDCFEVAMHREKFPEKVPFRLTRMLTHAMEVNKLSKQPFGYSNWFFISIYRSAASKVASATPVRLLCRSFETTRNLWWRFWRRSSTTLWSTGGWCRQKLRIESQRVCFYFFYLTPSRSWNRCRQWHGPRAGCGICQSSRQSSRAYAQTQGRRKWHFQW